VLTPTVLAIVSLVLIAMFAAVVKIFGTSHGYRILFVAIALSLVAKTILGW
jgi:hypothetical protein